MSAWFVMAAIGLFQTDGGCRVNPVYEIGSPLYERIVIDLGQRYGRGKTFTIEARDVSHKNKYVQNATLNGKKLDKFWFPAGELLKGGELILQMGPRPNKDWATGIEMPRGARQRGFCKESCTDRHSQRTRKATARAVDGIKQQNGTGECHTVASVGRFFRGDQLCGWQGKNRQPDTNRRDAWHDGSPVGWTETVACVLRHGTGPTDSSDGRVEREISVKAWEREPWKSRYPLFHEVMSDTGEFGRLWPIYCRF